MNSTTSETMGKPHVLVIPYPAQGHVMPLMELSHRLVENGLKITFVNTEFNHKRIVSSVSVSDETEEMIHLVSIPDGMGPEEDRNDLGKLSESILNVMPSHLETLILTLNETRGGDDEVSYIIADEIMGWALEVAQKMGIKKASFFPAAGGLLASILRIPKFIEDGIIEANGNLIKNQMIEISPTMPAINTADLAWLCMGDPSVQKAIFALILRSNQTIKIADYLICNSFYELEPSAFTLVPNLLPIGPLYASSTLANFWPENSTCLTWLDQQRPGSVVYVAFGSFTVLDNRQFEELALGLELCGQPFLWVVRPDLTEGSDIYPDGFEIRVASRGKMVSWAPQRQILAHPSVGYFLSHCGWNSTMEGVSQGVPFLCWPYFADQFLNQSYICDVWKVGIGLKKDDQNGLISKEEIKRKVIKLAGDKDIKKSSLRWKKMAMNNVNKGGFSLNNFKDFVQQIKS